MHPGICVEQLFGVVICTKSSSMDKIFLHKITAISPRCCMLQLISIYLSYSFISTGRVTGS